MITTGSGGTRCRAWSSSAAATTGWSPPATSPAPAGTWWSPSSPASWAAESRTDELLPGYRFNTHAAAHNIIHTTGILDELRLAGAGLTYRQMDPFSVAAFRDGTIVRFQRSVQATVDSIAGVDRAEARRYAAWIRAATPVVTAMRAAMGAAPPGGPGRPPGLLAAGLQAVARNGGPVGLGRALLSPYGRIVRERFTTELMRAPVSAFAAHASASPDAPGGASFALWQASYHQFGQWHPVGGSQALADALATRLRARRRVAVHAPVARVRDRRSPADRSPGWCSPTGTAGRRRGGHRHRPADRPAGPARPAAGRPGGRPAPLRPPRQRRAAARAPRHHGCPPYPDGRPGDWNGLQSYVDDIALAAPRLRRRRGPAAARRPGSDLRVHPERPRRHAGAARPPHRLPRLPVRALPGARRLGAPAARPSPTRMVATVEAARPGFTASIVGPGDPHARRDGATAALARRPPDAPRHRPRPARALRPTRRLARHTTPGVTRPGHQRRRHRAGRRHRGPARTRGRPRAPARPVALTGCGRRPRAGRAVVVRGLPGDGPRVPRRSS